MTEHRRMRVDISATRLTGRVKMLGARKQALESGRNRLVAVGIIFAIAFAFVGVRLVDVALLDGGREPRLARSHDAAVAPIDRADIVDRNGVVLATSLPTVSLYVHPHEFKSAREDADEAAARLAAVLPGLNPRLVAERLAGDNSFAWIRRNLTPSQQFQVNALGIAGLHFRSGERRVYPHGRLAAHVLGLTDVDGKGLAGVEKNFDAQLTGDDRPLSLSIDIRMQAAVQEELAASMAEFQAVGAAGLVMDVRSGEVLAMVSLPDFDPNDPAGMTADGAFNRVAKGVYELGSTFKVINTAIALDSGRVRATDIYETREPLRVGRFTITDFHPENRPLSVGEILIHSSNIGSAKMARDYGIATQQAYFEKMGLLSPVAIELPEVGKPLKPRTWREINAMTISYGHGIAVSPLQFASVVGAVVNGGRLVPPSVVRKGAEPIAGPQVIKEETSRQMRHLMRLVVKEGTGKQASAPGYRVGGKTGTAEKMIGGNYHRKKLISSFVGAFPMDDPRFVVLVMLDEPKGNKRTHNYATAGWVAAPMLGRLVPRIAAFAGIAPVFEDDPAPPGGGARSLMAGIDGDLRLAAN